MTGIGKNDRAAIDDALASIGTYRGISGPVTFDANGDLVKPLQILEVQNGALATAPRQPTSQGPTPGPHYRQSDGHRALLGHDNQGRIAPHQERRERLTRPVRFVPRAEWHHPCRMPPGEGAGRLERREDRRWKRH